MLIAIIAILLLEACQIDICNTYLEEKLEEKIYVKILEEMDALDKDNKAFLLIKKLYGLKQSGQF